MIQTENRDDTYVQLIAEADKHKVTGFIAVYAVCENLDNPGTDLCHEAVFNLDDYEAIMMAIDEMMANPTFKVFTFTDSGKKYMKEVHGEEF